MKREPRIVEAPLRPLIGMSREMSRREDRTAELWRAFMPRRHEVANRSSRRYVYIFAEWLPGSRSYQLDDREHFELLPPDYDPRDPNAREEIWIPIRPRTAGA